MLAVCTTTALVLLDTSTLKKAPASVPSTLTLTDTPTASTWAPDNSTLFVAHESAIHRYDATGTSLGTVSTGPTAGPVTALASKDKGDTLIFGDRDGITVVDTDSGRVAVRLDTHTGPVSGLALAQDAALLASTAESSAPGSVPEVHVHNLAAASHDELQGLPRRGEVTACVFHPHSKSKLLVAVGMQLLVYDVAKPSSPLRTIQLDRRSGETVAIACSPFSKTLVAVGCSSGVVNLVDLDKEKGLFRTLPLEARSTSLVFSPEGAALYSGTEDGRVLVLDLRALDKPAKSIAVSPYNEQIICLAVQRKLKPGESLRPGVRPTTTTLSKRKPGAEPPSPASKFPKAGPSTTPSSPSAPLLKPKLTTTSRTSLSPGPSPGRVVRTRTISATSSTPAKPTAKPRADPSKSSPPAPRTRTVPIAPAKQSAPPPMPPPMRVRTVSAATSASSRGTSGTSGASSVSSRTTRMSSSTSGTSVGLASPTISKVSGGLRKVVSPKASPTGSDNELDNVPTERPFPTSKRTSTLPTQDKPVRQPNIRSRTTSTTSARPASTRAAPGPSEARTTATTTRNLSPSSLTTRPRPRTTSSRSSATAQPRTRPQSRNSPSISPIPPVPALPEAFREQLTEIDIRLRTPSPELHSDDEAYTPIPMRKRDKGKGKEPERPKTNVLGLGTPELKKWIAKEAGQEDEDVHEERRNVAFLEVPTNELQIQSIQVVDEDGHTEEAPGGLTEAGKATIQMTVRVSPRRSQEKLSPNWGPLPSLFSPSRILPSTGQDGGSSSGQQSANPAHELLQSLIRDAMYDYRRETKAEILGLHLDLVRMGRGWRKEMKEALDLWGAELKEIRRENEMLRKENERLRRGY